MNVLEIRFIARNMATTKKPGTSKRDRKTMRQARSIITRHESGIPVDGYLDQLEKKSSYSHSKHQYAQRIQPGVASGTDARNALYLDMMAKKDAMLQAGALMVEQLMEEARILTNAVIILDKRVQRTELCKNKQHNALAVILTKKEASQANKLVRYWKQEYNVSVAVATKWARSCTYVVT